MAKAKTLAALAGLAGLAYAMRNKDKSEDAGEQKTSSYTKDTKKVEATDEPRRQITDYIKKAPTDAESSMQSNMLGAITAPKAASNDKAPNQGVVPSKTVTPKAPPKPTVAKQAPSDPRLAETSTSRGRPAVAKNPNYSNEGRNSVAPAKNPNYSNEGRSSTAPTSTPVATTTKISDVPKSTANKFEHEMPISRFFKNVREAGNRGNPDVKMASGGMTASRRGDGIAQRGKTRGKMC